jgi:hypothetical protein
MQLMYTGRIQESSSKEIFEMLEYETAPPLPTTMVHSIDHGV